MHQLLVLSRHAADYRRLIEGAALPDLAIACAADPASLPEDASRAVIVFGEPALIAPALPRLPAVRWIQSTWAGVEPLLNPALRRDYLLTNARGVFGSLMSEYVFGYLLAHERRMFARYESQKSGRWDASPPGTLRGRRIGLLGVGTIGAALARTARHFGMRVRGYTRRSQASPDVDEYFHADKAAFARDLDYLVCIMPNTPATAGFVDRTLLDALPPRAVLVNPGRGSSVDEAALVEALAGGRLAGAVLDVFQTEPLPPEHPLWRAPHVIITSHTAALSAPSDITPLFLDNYRRFAAGSPLQYVVDFDAGY
jgi:phosphoglycerate dehydrogenase-like enzyme